MFIITLCFSGLRLLPPSAAIECHWRRVCASRGPSRPSLGHAEPVQRGGLAVGSAVRQPGEVTVPQLHCLESRCAESMF